MIRSAAWLVLLPLGWCGLVPLAAEDPPLPSPREFPAGGLAPPPAAVPAAAVVAEDHPGTAPAPRREAVAAAVADVDREPPSPSARTAQLAAELQVLLANGGFASMSREEAGDLARVVFAAWLRLDQPERALRLAEAMAGEGVHAEQCSELAERLAARGDQALAGRASALALRMDPYERQYLDRQCRLDPGAGLAVLAELAAVAGTTAASCYPRQHLQLLAAARRRPEAAQVFQALLAKGEAMGAWQLLHDWDPELCLQQLAGPAGGALSPDTHRRWRASALARAGRSAEARELLAPFASHDGADDRDFERLLRRVDPAAALARLDARSAAGARSAESDLDRAQLLERCGRRAEALAVYAARLVELPRRCAAPLLAADLPTYGSALLAVAQRLGDDEVAGDVGDAWWAAGDVPQAVFAWRVARALDPSDNEWLGKLDSAAQGWRPPR